MLVSILIILLGKTTLVSRIVDFLLERKSASGAQKLEGTVLYFYFKHQRDDKNVLVGMLLALITQILQQDESLIDFVYEACSTADEAAIRSEAKLSDLVETAIKSQRACFMVLDGLDECGTGADRTATQSHEVITWVQNLFGSSTKDRSSGPMLRVLYSGQRDGFLDQRLSCCTPIRLESTLSHVDDIRRYTEAQACAMRRKFRLSQTVEADVVRRVTSNSNGKKMPCLKKVGQVLTDLRHVPLRQASHEQSARADLPCGLQRRAVS